MIFVGREPEFREARALLTSAADGRGGLRVIVGEPGIGKTRLADAVAADAAARGFRVAWGRAWESGGAPAYFPWSQVASALGVAFPEASATALDPEVARFQLCRAVVDLLRTASLAAPLLLVLDDMHVADVSSLRMLEFVARELRSLRAAILATHRDVDAKPSPDAAAMLARIAREGQVVALRRLDRAEVAKLVSDASLSADLEPAIWQTTQGNPLFVEEVVRLLRADPSAGKGGSLPIPFGVREVIRQRLGRLDANALAALDVASVIGIEIEAATLASAAGRSREEIAETLAAARAAGILIDAGAERFRFGHALMRDALYNDVPASQKKALHAAIADALESRANAPPSEIAHHAIEAGWNDRTGERVLGAARGLVDAFAHEDAIRLLERGIAAAPVEDAGIADLWLALGGAKMRAGDAAGGARCCVRVAEQARAHGDGALFARAALAYGSEFTIGSTDPTLRALLEEGLDRLGPGENEGLRARMQARLAASLHPSPDPQALAKLAMSAVEAARGLDDETLLEVLHFAGATFSEAVAAPEILPLTIDAVRLATRVGDRAKLLRAYTRLIFQLVEIGDVVAADAHIDAYDAVARATGQPRHTWLTPMFRSMRALQEGRNDEADALAEDGRALAAQARDSFFDAQLALHRMCRFRLQDRVAECLAAEPEALAVVAKWNASDVYTNLFTATFRAVAGDAVAARAYLARVPLDSTPARIRIALGHYASSAVLAGHATHAADLYERLLPSASLWLVYGLGGFVVEGTYARLLGGLAAMLERWDVAERHFEDAIARAESVGARPEVARVRAAYAAMLRARGDEAGARSLAAPTNRAPSAFTMTSEGETWELAHDGSAIRLRDSRGLAYLARLVAEAGREVHALDLAGASEVDAGDAGEMLDADARAAYKARLAELDDEVREAQTWNDGARVARARGEIQILSAELARAVGLGGRSRRAGAAAERARVAVTRRIRDAVRRISELSPALGKYLERTVKTGTFCSYQPP